MTDSRNQRYRIYLAGPEVFLPDAGEIGARKKRLCADYGFEGVFPFDAEVSLENKTTLQAGLEISAANESLIRSCDAVIANITPFRGPSADVGTAYEMGFGRALGLRVLAYSNLKEMLAERTREAIQEARDARRMDWTMSIEDFGFVDNLMLDGAVLGSGFEIVTADAANERFTALGGFEECVRRLRAVVNL